MLKSPRPSPLPARAGRGSRPQCSKLRSNAGWPSYGNRPYCRGLMKDQIARLLDQKDYVPANVPELLRLLRLPPQRQQLLQGALRELEQSGRIARIKGNRYILPREADLIPGRIRMNRQGKGFLQALSLWA